METYDYPLNGFLKLGNSLFFFWFLENNKFASRVLLIEFVNNLKLWT